MRCGNIEYCRPLQSSSDNKVHDGYLSPQTHTRNK